MWLVGCVEEFGMGTRPLPNGPALETLPGGIDSAAETATDGDPPDDDDDALVFDPAVVHRVELSLAPASMDALNADPFTWQRGGFSYDGQAFEDVGIRAKGRLGSARDFPSKVALKIDLKEYGVDQDLEGIEKLNLNNMVQDCAKLKELAAYGAHRVLGQPAPRVVYAQLFVNGDDYGLYSVVEDFDDEFLKRSFAQPEGNLYDGDYWLYPDWSSYILVDFVPSSEDYFELDEGVDNGRADIHAVTDLVASGAPLAEIGERVDLDQHAAFLAATAWTGHYDSYSYYSNNYRVYFDPGRGGKAVIIPWDPDWAFYASTPVTTGYGVLSARCLADGGCRATASAYADELSRLVPKGELQAEVEAAMALIEPYLAADPKLESSLGDIHACQEDLLGWFSRRGGELDAMGF